jgi:hypothetical protein
LMCGNKCYQVCNKCFFITDCIRNISIYCFHHTGYYIFTIKWEFIRRQTIQLFSKLRLNMHPRISHTLSSLVCMKIYHMRLNNNLESEEWNQKILSRDQIAPSPCTNVCCLFGPRKTRSPINWFLAHVNTHRRSPAAPVAAVHHPTPPDASPLKIPIHFMVADGQ